MNSVSLGMKPYRPYPLKRSPEVDNLYEIYKKSLIRSQSAPQIPKKKLKIGPHAMCKMPE